MIRRIYADNYKCLVNFECKLDRINLILGANGTGKSTVFDVLRDVQDVVTGRCPIKSFRESTLTRWQQRDVQTFELDIEGNGGLYTYRLEVEHQIGKDLQRIRREAVTFGGRPLYSSEVDNGRLIVRLFRDNHSPGPEFGGDWSQSGLTFLGELPENTKVTWLKRWFREKLFCLQIDPLHMRPRADAADPSLDPYALNYVGWYRHRIATDMGASNSLFAALKEMYDEFGGLALEREGGNVEHLFAKLGVQVEERGKPVSVKYSFGELSDGERALIVLYSLLQLMSDEETTLCLDEPDNYVALSEIQPWLLETKGAVHTNQSQSILVSHHPELINNLAPHCGLVLERDRNGPTRIRAFDAKTSDAGLTPSEVVARGWE